MICKIFKHQLVYALSSPRVYIGLIIGCVSQILSVMPLYDYSLAIGKPMGIVEGYIYWNCDTYTSVVAFLGLLLFISDVPFTSSSETYILLRSTRYKWVLGKMLYLFVATVIYYFLVMVSGAVYLFQNAFIGNVWSEPLRYLVTGSTAEVASAYNVYFPYPYILKLSPYLAAFSCLGLSTAYGYVMSLLVFFLNFHFPRTLAYAGTMVFHTISYALTALLPGNGIKKYSLLGNSLILYHDIGGYLTGSNMPTILESLIVFLLATVIMFILILYCIRNYNFNIANGTYNND